MKHRPHQHRDEILASDEDDGKSSVAAFFVYILRSKKDGRLYIGSSHDPATSLQRHNFGDYRATNSFRPWILVHQEGFASLPEARQREWYLKSPVGKQYVTSLHLP